MKRNEKILKILNSLLSDELTAIDQSIIRSEFENRDIGDLSMIIRKKAMAAERLMKLISFFDGSPNRINAQKIGNSFLYMIGNDNDDEVNDVWTYNNSIKFSLDIDDQDTDWSDQYI